MSKNESNSRLNDPYKRVMLDDSDFEVMNLVLDQVPELRICAAIVKAAREQQMEYPFKSHDPLVKLLPEKIVLIEGHCIRPALIKRYMPEAYFPIQNEKELIARCYLAFMRCRADVSWAANAPSYATTLLEEYQSMSTQKGEV